MQIIWGINQHRQTFLVDENGVIEHVFNKFKTKEHHTVVLDYLNS
ncbi:putative bacterioferritin comigratory protein [Alteromonas macleodii]|uniref:Bacterioferritin comigratory protein n=1 Tax=Alteromonas macleodii TaxID=28108 RepID=A0AB36FX58_ALTMA|nr:putative bacterioferritin comigratory protein [Alteromonas macleodii]OES31344.1 putative bacterioferritin comigratory protein [Alteromonas macleodii]OES31675.1 putative bacterioferritin comigratory protein [Alteromonas macleodii]OES40801.1 putative bacterioferritin comigratory protein [Alteromonas macleodii]